MTLHATVSARDLIALHCVLRCAVRWQDENGDGKPNFCIFPPKFLEGFAFSNGYRPRMKPNYDKAKFEPEPGATVRLDLSY